MLRNVFLAGITLVLVGCGRDDTATPVRGPQSIDPPLTAEPAADSAGAQRSAIVEFEPADDHAVSGTLAVTTLGDAVGITGSVSGLNPHQEHGFHIHENGDCSTPDASSAGAHFNPYDQPHGRPGPGSHLGDLLNLRADAQGIATAAARIERATLHTGLPNDLVGRAVVVHQNADDYASQPAGDAGARIACGVIK